MAPRNSTSTRCKSMKIQIGYFLPKSKHGLGQNLPLDGGAEQKVERWSDPALACWDHEDLCWQEGQIPAAGFVIFQRGFAKIGSHFWPCDEGRGEKANKWIAENFADGRRKICQVSRIASRRTMQERKDCVRLLGLLIERWISIRYRIFIFQIQLQTISLTWGWMGRQGKDYARVLGLLMMLT